MAIVSEILSTVITEHFYLASLSFGPRWAISFEQKQGIKFTTVTRGACWIKLAGHTTPIYLTAGDCFLMSSGRAFTVSSAEGLTAVNADRYRVQKSERSQFFTDQGTDTQLVGGRFFYAKAAVDTLSQLLPEFVCIKANDPRNPRLTEAISRFVEEARSTDETGSTFMIDLLAKMMMIELIRHSISQGLQLSANPLIGMKDERISRAMEAMHSKLSHAWNLTDLASLACMSRSNFSTKFRALVGSPPLDYLQKRRMLQAASLLSKSSLSITEIAHTIGYDTESGFSTTFRRVMGIAPQKYRSDFTKPK
ncbi:AraC family transcriptional regulator [Asaia sp. BMEF1]|uniref:AraC family transcriptional regulator n=1 Tax=Asaia sp. BMEF1 TaxID=3155932 RepID=UPI003F6755A2